MYSYEDFFNFYRPSNILRCAKTDVRNYITAGVFWVWMIFVVAFFIFWVGLIIKTGWLSLLFIISGLPFMFSWGIYVVREPNTCLFKQQINQYLEEKYTQEDWERFLNYVTLQYGLEDSKPIWRTGYGVTWLSFAVGQLISLALDSDELLNMAITSIMIQSAIAIVALLYFVDNIWPRRKTRIHLAITDIKKFQNNKLPLLA